MTESLYNDLKVTFNRSHMDKVKFSSNLIIPAYVVGVAGAFLQISGGFWDVSSHIMGIVETFFTIPHLILYAGVVLSLVASLTGLALRRIIPQNNGPKSALFTGLKVSLVGGALQLVAGPFDFWWHSTYGFDPHLFTPSHSILITGIILNGVGMAIAATRLVQASRTGISLGRFATATKGLELLAIVSLTTLWLALNGLVYLITDVNGLNYTFHFGNTWVQQATTPAFIVAEILLAAVGSLVFLTTKKTLSWRGAISAVTLLGALVVTTANLGFRAWYLTNSANADLVPQGTTIASFIPLYLVFLIPVVAFDFVLGNSQNRTRTIIAATLVAPFASYLDGFYSLGLWTSATALIPILLFPMFAAGTIAALYQTKFVNLFITDKLNLVSQPGMK